MMIELSEKAIEHFQNDPNIEKSYRIMIVGYG